MKNLNKKIKFITFTISHTVDVVQELKNIFRVIKYRSISLRNNYQVNKQYEGRDHQKTAKIDNLGHKKCIKIKFYATFRNYVTQRRRQKNG